jgi:hypothetical protein
MIPDGELRKKLVQLRNIHGKIYAPLKYFRGLSSLKSVETRYKKMIKKDYSPFKTDYKVVTKKSRYTTQFKKRYPGITKMNDIAKATGIPLKTLNTIYNRGLAAWRTGHRPGANQQSWARARVYSFIVKGKTYYTADKDLRK